MSELDLENRVEHLEKRLRRMQIMSLCMFCVLLIIVSLLGISQSMHGMAFSRLLNAQRQSVQGQIDSDQ